MRKQFLDYLIKKYPNDFSLGHVVRKYWLISQKFPKESSEKIEKRFLDLNFQPNP